MVKAWILPVCVEKVNHHHQSVSSGPSRQHAGSAIVASGLTLVSRLCHYPEHDTDL
jgi:hypothetical protein